MPLPPTSPPRVVIAGGGVAALEALIALRDIAGDAVRVTMLAPTPDFVYRPLAVAEPFCLGRATHHPLRQIAADFGAEFVQQGVAEVDPANRRVVLTDGATTEYDALLIAVGARSQPVFERAITFGADTAPDALAGLLADLEDGYVRRVAFVFPSPEAWGLPLYELALMTARDAESAGMSRLELTLVTPEAAPLGVFGDEASAAVGRLLDAAGIAFIGATTAEVGHNEVVAGERRIAVDRTVTLPVPVGPSIPGLPEDGGGFLPVEEHARVRGIEDVYAAGDVTDSPIKQGGLAAQQAVAAAEAIAARAGVDIEPEPYRPVLRGMLLTAGPEQWLRGPVGDTAAASEASPNALWWPPTKIATKYLAPYLLGRDEAARLARRPQQARAVSTELG